MISYLSAEQMAALLMTWSALVLIFRSITATSAVNVLVFCILPLLLSSFQLFVFGTYLPHRRQREEASNRLPDSLDFPLWLSLLTCFHFGYHREHHQNPRLAWFELPRARRGKRSLPAT